MFTIAGTITNPGTYELHIISTSSPHIISPKPQTKKPQPEKNVHRMGLGIQMRTQETGVRSGDHEAEWWLSGSANRFFEGVQVL